MSFKKIVRIYRAGRIRLRAEEVDHLRGAANEETLSRVASSVFLCESNTAMAQRIIRKQIRSQTAAARYFLFTFSQISVVLACRRCLFEWLPILRAKKVCAQPFYNTRHTYVSFLYSIGARSGFISSQTGDSIKTLENDYARYIEEAGSGRDFVEEQIQKSATGVHPPYPATPRDEQPGKEKAPINRGLKNGAGEEGRTPDLMLGKHTL